VGEGIPFIHAGINGLLGEITTIIPGKTPCFACIFPQSPGEGGTFPVFGVTPALVAILQVTETIKLLAGFGDLLAGKMLYFNGETMEFTIVDLIRRPDCSVCGGDRL
jgi:adenylyltransferase/sulfurtransferase